MTENEPTSMNGEIGIVFVVQSRVTGILSATWSIRSHRTSFYLSPLGVGATPLKLSLHGADDRPHTSDPGFKLDVVRENLGRAAEQGSRIIDASGYLPQWFTGHEVAPGVRHVLRFMYRPAMFVEGTPSAPVPEPSASATIHSRFAAPVDDEVVYLDVCVSERKPFWENVNETRAADAGIGPIVNTNREYLTVIARRVPYREELDPFSDDYQPLDDHDPEADGPVRRVEAFRHDAHSVMWITEVLMPERVIDDPANAYQPPPKNSRRAETSE